MKLSEADAVLGLAIEQPPSVVAEVLMMVANTVAGVLTCTARPPGRIAATRLPADVADATV